MGDLAIAVIVGRLTRDAELKYTNSGQAVCHFAVATGARVKKGDQWVEESSFWDVDLWGKRAEGVNQWLTKGKLVAVQGDMRIEKWEKDGQTRMKVLITAQDVQLLGGGEGRGDRQESRQERPPAPRPTRPSAEEEARARRERDGVPPPSDDFTDDIPF